MIDPGQLARASWWARLGRVAVPVLFALCFVMLVGFIPMQQNADGLLLSIMSLQKLTVYYWAADRYGILTALLAVGIRDPVLNMYFQVILEMLAGLLAPLFFCELLLRRAADSWRAVLLTDGLLLGFGHFAVLKQIFIQASPYGTSLACAGLAALLLRSGRTRLMSGFAILLAGLLIAAAYVVNFGLITIALPLVLLFALILPRRRAWILFALHALAAILGRVLPTILAPHFHTNLGLFFSPADLIRYAGVVGRFTGGWFVIAVTLPAVAFFLALIRARRHRAAWRWASLFAAVAAIAALHFTVIASSHWLVMNNFPIRYFVPAYLALISLGGTALWLALKLGFRRDVARGPAFAAAVLLLLLAGVARFHAHPVDNRAIVDANMRDLASAVAARTVALSLDGIAGAGHSDGYWSVWPAVFLAEEAHFRAGYHGPAVLGVTDRGVVRRAAFAVRLAAQGQFRLACIDLLPADCAADAAKLMAMPGLKWRSFAATAVIGGGHRLTYVALLPAAKG